LVNHDELVAYNQRPMIGGLTVLLGGGGEHKVVAADLARGVQKMILFLLRFEELILIPAPAALVLMT
jgi:hypothetical protein